MTSLTNVNDCNVRGPTPGKSNNDSKSFTSVS